MENNERGDEEKIVELLNEEDQPTQIDQINKDMLIRINFNLP